MDPNNPTEAVATESIPPAKTAEEKAPTFEAITSQEQLNAVLADRLKRERAKYGDYNDLKAKAARLDEIEQAAKSDLEKATEANAKLTAELEALKLNQLRTEIAVSKGLDPASARFLTGTTREQIEADADDLVKLTGSTPPEPRPARSPESGTRPRRGTSPSQTRSRLRRPPATRPLSPH